MPRSPKKETGRLLVRCLTTAPQAGEKAHMYTVTKLGTPLVAGVRMRTAELTHKWPHKKYSTS